MRLIGRLGFDMSEKNTRSTQPAAPRSDGLFPIDPRDKPVACHLKSLTISTVYEPEISLIHDGKEVAGLALDDIDIRRPGRSLRLEAGCVICRENRSPVRSIPVHHDKAIAAGFTLRREDRLQIRDLILLFPRTGL